MRWACFHDEKHHVIVFCGAPVRTCRARSGSIHVLLVDWPESVDRKALILSCPRFSGEKRFNCQRNHGGMEACRPHPWQPRCNCQWHANDPKNYSKSIDLLLEYQAPRLDEAPSYQDCQGSSAH